MADKTTSIGILADFNVQNLAVLLQKNSHAHKVRSVSGPFAQTVSVLLDPGAQFWSAHHDAVVVWTAPERAVPGFGKLLSFEKYSLNDLLAEVDSFARLLENIPDETATIVVPNWTLPATERGWGPLEMVNGIGIANALMHMNLRLADALGRNRRVVLLDSHRWLTTAGAGSYNPKLWYLSKTPFDTVVFQEASKDILAALDGIHGRGKKIVILDLDDTLWGGIVGDAGWQKLQLGGHNPMGEAFADFQKGLKRLINRGVLLALVSKNEESVALEAIDRHPEMILKKDDFVAWRINWRDKAENIFDLVSALNLGLESAVFLDDSPFERARVREALPQVLVPDLPADPMYYSQFLSGLRCFDNPFVSSEDRSRTSMYVADRGRTELKSEMVSLEQWLAMLDLKIAVEPLSEKNLERAAQLFNKTNQMNLSTRRLAAADLLSWSQKEGHALWTFRVWDKFGDYGLCGITSLVRNGDVGQILDYLLSCRAMGRGVEDAMLACVLQHARDRGCETVFAEYIQTPRNEPCRKWLQSLPGAVTEDNRVAFGFNEGVVVPPHIQISFHEANEKISV